MAEVMEPEGVYFGHDARPPEGRPNLAPGAAVPPALKSSVLGIESDVWMESDTSAFFVSATQTVTDESVTVAVGEVTLRRTGPARMRKSGSLCLSDVKAILLLLGEAIVVAGTRACQDG
jgi:hypothetical protein